MSIRTVQSSALAPRHTAVAARNTSGTINNTTTPWVRNPSWLPLPSVGDTEQKFVGLYAVFPDANFIAVNCGGEYTVDWGDGTTQDFANGVQANYEYSFDDTDLANTNAPVTFQDAGDTVTRTAHGYTNGMSISFAEIVSTTGIVAGQIYFIVGATANTFQVSSTLGGSALALTTDGTGVILGYKQVVVTITPQAAQNLTTLNLNVRNSTPGLVAGLASGWLDILVSGPNLTTLTISAAGQNVTHGYLEQAQLISTNNIASFASTFHTCRDLRSIPVWTPRTVGAVDMNQMFFSCSSLQTVPLFNTAAVTNMGNMFNNCPSLQTVPLFDTAAVTLINNMFQSCVSLQTVPLFDTAAVTSISSMFGGCQSLQTVPLFNTAAVTNMGNMFSSCQSLQTVPLFNTAAVTSMGGMFNGCPSLQTVPLFDTAAVTSISSMFGGCQSLQTVPLFNTAAVTSMSGMFNGCPSLQTVPLFNTAAVTSMLSMFNNCPSLQTVPLFDTAAVTLMNSMFNNCPSLQTVPLFDTAAVTSMGGMFNGCPSLAKIAIFGTRFNLSVANCKLSTDRIEEVFENLGVGASQTVTITGNYGVGTAVTLTGTTTTDSTTVTMASTTGLVVGMLVTGTGVSTDVAVTLQTGGNTVTRTAHGIANDTPVSFATLVTTTGIIINTRYFVINTAADTFQLALTAGGAAITLTDNGSGTLRYGTTITAITTNTNITLSIPASASGSVSLVSRLLNSSLATLKGWAVTF